MVTAPRARQVVTSIGSISGVRPTATEIAKSTAFNQSPLVKPLINSTTGTMTSMKRMSTQETELMPFSKVVCVGLAERLFAMLPRSVSFPTAATTPTALPLTTVLPIRTALGFSVMDCGTISSLKFFSTGSLSPVKADWLRNKSFADTMRRSAGTISPALRCTRSPTATSSSGISRQSESARSTQAVVRIISESFAAAFPLRVSCTKRRMPEIMTIVTIIITVVGFFSPGAGSKMSVKVDTTAKAAKIAVNGLTNAPQIRLASVFLLPCVITLQPYSSLA